MIPSAFVATGPAIHCGLIHWRQTARNDRLIVRELQNAASSSSVQIILNDNLGSYPTSDCWESAIQLAANLFACWSGDGHCVQLVVRDKNFGSLSVVTRTSDEGLDALALLEKYRPVSSRLDSPEFELPKTHRGTPSIFITPLDQPRKDRSHPTGKQPMLALRIAVQSDGQIIWPNQTMNSRAAISIVERSGR